MNNLYNIIRKRYILFLNIILSSIIILKGLGLRELYEISIYIFLTVQICRSEKIYHTIQLFLLLLLHVLVPGISLLWGYCSLIFVLEKQTLSYAALCLFLWIGEQFNMIPCSAWLILILIVLSSLLNFLSRKYVKGIIVICSIFVIILTVYSLPCWKNEIYAEKYVKSVFSPSEVFCKVTNTKYANGHQKIDDRTNILRSIPFYTKVPIHQPGILIFEVDYQGEYANVDPHIWQQPTPWDENQLIGNQYYLESIRYDGGLYSNKGITLDDKDGSTQLAYIESFTKNIPLIVKHDNVLYLHDSDYSSSFLANYQKCFLNELTGNGDRPNYIRILNILCVFLICIECCIKQKNKWKLEFALLPFICIVMYQIYCSPIEGDIRLVGKITNSHENNSFDGVVKKIVFAGFDYIVGKENTKILVVQKGKRASVKTEKLIIAEEGCTIKIGGKEFRVNNNPIGNVNGVIDARQWLYEDNVYDGIMKVDNIVLIATGSPALQQWKKLLN